MLQTQAIDPATLELLISLQGKDYLSGFNLVGGTALALYMGHRRSIDIDLFSNFKFQSDQLIELIQQDYPFQIYFTASNTVKGSIANVNVDFIAHTYPNINEPIEEGGIRILSKADIIAMKLNAISTSGQRSKDFVDIYFALEENSYSISDMLKFYQIKYRQQSVMHILKSLIYFEDVDLSDWPILLRMPHLKWIDIEKRLEKDVFRYMKDFQVG